MNYLSPSCVDFSRPKGGEYARDTPYMYVGRTQRTPHEVSLSFFLFLSYSHPCGTVRLSLIYLHTLVLHHVDVVETGCSVGTGFLLYDAYKP